MKPEYRPKTTQQKLGYLVEECGEVLATVGKTQRWGLESRNPELPPDSETNREWILREMEDLELAIKFVREDLTLEEKQTPTPSLVTKREDVDSADRGDGQQKNHLVLSEEELAKGFIRPLHRAYIHKGVRPQHPVRPLTHEEKVRYQDRGYSLFEISPESDSPRVGRYWTQTKLDSGCGVKTTVGLKIAETYARQPNFYGSTFCAGCHEYFPVEEFVWDGTDDVVGS